jgi:hypothetical protein
VIPVKINNLFFLVYHHVFFGCLSALLLLFSDLVKDFE